MKLTSLLAVLTLCCACHYRLYVNNQLSYSGPGVGSKWLKTNDSFFIAGLNETLPDSAVLIESVSLSGPREWYSNNGRSILVDQLKPEAQKAGANLIRITWASAPLRPDSLTANLYLLKEPYKTGYQGLLDSIRRRHADSCIVHVVNFALFDTCFLYYRSELIGYSPAPRRADRLPGAEAQTFAFGQSGHFHFSGSRNSSRIRMRKGKEYFVWLYYGGYRHGMVYLVSDKNYFWQPHQAVFIVFAASQPIIAVFRVAPQ